MEMTVDVSRPDPATVVVTATGEIDAGTAPLLRAKFIDVFAGNGPGAHLVVDLTPVPFIDGTGLSVVVGAHRRATASGVQMTVVAIDRVRRVMQLAGVDQLWRTVATLDEALNPPD